MKNTIKLFVLLSFVMLITGCGINPIKSISYSDLEKKLNNKDTFILEVVQDGCHNCESFTPKFKKILNKNKIDAYSVNLTSLSKEDTNKIDNLYKVSGTPTVIFITKGEEKSISQRIVGDRSDDFIIEKLKIAGYIK